MAKIKLGERPKSFKSTVKFPMLDGTEGAILCEFKYRTRKEFGEFIDGIMAAAALAEKEAKKKKEEEKTPTAEAVATPADGEKFSMSASLEKIAGANTDYILQVLEGWSLDEELTRENLQQLADEIPAAASAIMERYRVAVTEGRLGN